MSPCFHLRDAFCALGPDSVIDLDDRDHTFDEGWFDVTYFLDLSHIRCHTGAYSVSDEIHGSSWSYMIIITYWMHTETLTSLLPNHDTSVDPLWIYLARPSCLDIWLLSFFLFWDTFLGCMDLIWITEITCSMIEDFMSPDFWPTVHLMPYWGIFPFWIRFTDHDGVARLSPLARCMPRRWSIRCFYDDSSVETLGSHPVRLTLPDT